MTSSLSNILTCCKWSVPSSVLMCLWMQCELEQHIILHVSAALLEAVWYVVSVMHSSRSANTLRTLLHTHTPFHTNNPCTHTQLPTERGSQHEGSAQPLYEACFWLDYPNSTSALKGFKLEKCSSFPWYLTGLMTNKPSCWYSKSKEQLAQAKQTSLINTTKCNLKSHKCKSLKNTKGTCLFFT